MAGGGVKRGFTYGASDDFAYNPAVDPVHVHDFQATVMHLLGIDHEKLTFRFQGRDFRLTDVHGRVVKEAFGLGAQCRFGDKPRNCRSPGQREG